MTLDNAGIEALLERYDKETKALKKEAIKMMWFMRGSLSYDEAMLLSAQDQEIIAALISDNLDTTAKSRLPFF